MQLYLTASGVREIGKHPFLYEDGEVKSGFQGCNLCEINGSLCDTPEDFYKACRAAAILGTLQAGYTDFKFLTDVSKKIFEKEALLGVSVTGWMNNPKVLFDKEVLKKGANIVKEVNKLVAKLININPAARTTCVKPSGNASVLLKTASGIHGEHSKRYFRVAQLNKQTDVAKAIFKINPDMVEDSVWSANNTDYAVFYPFITKENSLYKSDLYGVKLLEYVKFVQQVWVEEGTDIDLCVNKSVRHNVSNTVQVDNWDEVREYIWDNKEYFSGISLLPLSGDKDYAQAPNTEVLTPQEILDKYGEASMFASGLIVDALSAYNNSLWLATSTAQGFGLNLDEDRHDLVLKKDWVRRFKKFAETFFNSDVKKAEYCLKDVYLLHKWVKIQKSLKPIDWKAALTEDKLVDIDTMGAIACAGGACEI